MRNVPIWSGRKSFLASSPSIIVNRISLYSSMDSCPYWKRHLNIDIFHDTRPISQIRYPSSLMNGIFSHMVSTYLEESSPLTTLKSWSWKPTSRPCRQRLIRRTQKGMEKLIQQRGKFFTRELLRFPLDWFRSIL